MTRRLVSSGAPLEPTIGFSRAVRVGAAVWVAGTAPIWPSGEVDGGVAVQAGRCLDPRWRVEIEADAVVA